MGQAIPALRCLRIALLIVSRVRDGNKEMLCFTSCAMNPCVNFPLCLIFSSQTLRQRKSTKVFMLNFSSGVKVLKGFGKMGGILAELI